MQSFTEAIRYLDVHPFLPDEDPAEIKAAFPELLGSLLLNSALVAHKLGGSDNARSAVQWTTRALDRAKLTDAEKSMYLIFFISEAFSLSFHFTDISLPNSERPIPSCPCAYHAPRRRWGGERLVRSTKDIAE